MHGALNMNTIFVACSAKGSRQPRQSEKKSLSSRADAN